MNVDPRLAGAAPGSRVGPFDVEVGAGWSARLAAAAGASPHSGAYVVPVMAGQLALAVYAACIPGPMIHTRQHTRHHGQLGADSVAQCAGTVGRRFAKRGRPYVEIDFEVSAGETTVWTGMILCTNPNTSCEGLPDEPGTSAHPVWDGDVVSVLEHAFDLEAMAAFSGPGNIHSDVEVARSVGLDRPVVQGMQVAALCERLLSDRWGDAWPVRGEWDVRFVGMAWAGESLEAALLAGPPAPNGDREELEDRVGLRVAKTDGTACLVGWAGLAIPSRPV